MREVFPLKQFFDGSNYRSQLSAPQWEEFRRAYVARHGSYCRSCNRSGVEVQLHHIVYDRDKTLWEHDDQDLALLCRECHERWHNLTKSLRRLLGGMRASEVQMIVGAFSMLVKLHSAKDLCFTLAQLAAEPETARRLCRSWETT